MLYYREIYRNTHIMMAVSNKNLKGKKSRSISTSHRNCSACRQNKCPLPAHSSMIDRVSTAIECFHNNLCSLPLDSLINSTHPQVWLDDQHHTC